MFAVQIERVEKPKGTNPELEFPSANIGRSMFLRANKEEGNRYACCGRDE
jgi:hypothetical protein